MDPLLRVTVTHPRISSPLLAGKQIEIIQVQQQESYFNLVTESNSIFFSPSFQGRMRCGSKFIDAKANEPVAAYLGKGYPLVIDAPSMVPWWIVHIHDEVRTPANVLQPVPEETVHAVVPVPTTAVASTESMSFYKIHSGQDFLMASLMEQMSANRGVPEGLLEELLRELPQQIEPCSNLPASGNRRLAEKLRQRILEAEDKHINLKEIAEQLDCHPSQLSREFRRLFGIAPYKFSFLLRLAKTREWLRSGKNLADIALNFEFSDQSHFTRAFRQVYQMTPNFYRNLYRTWWEVNPSIVPTTGRPIHA
jgi:AraC-like DNA-binding protein